MHHPPQVQFSRSSPCRTFLIVVGTRPEVIKVAPLIRRLRDTSWARVKIVASGQQSDLLGQTLAEFGLTPDITIRHRDASSGPAQVASRLIQRLDRIFGEENPDCVIAQGDTTTAYAASVAAFYQKIAYAHIEAGLRTSELDAPFPEEFHRRAIAVSATLHFAPTSAAARNLIDENVPKDRVHVSGNTVIDSLLEVAATRPPPPAEFGTRRMILLTAHRRENFGPKLRDALTGVRAFVDLTPDVGVYFPIHPNPNARDAALEILSGNPRIHLVEPLGYRDMVAAIQNAWCVVTDSGGLQEEAPALAKPVLVLRDLTERPEAVASGVVELVGTSREGVFKSLYALHKSPAKYTQMARPVFPYGDGHASRRIVDALYRHFSTDQERQDATIVPLQYAS
ncbi:hypothetical protein XI06_13690 [Bradyrhizobium sp. CCBAU 11434]|uniref:non-hydrolyzing UDP-N-acetylglucosamine 2-epimerase n=1 Tax=Bradyrhizobium sp. CCBAU 11434 TaxID=1630885 RepID=UPI0023052408|nr:UDP-N-acetylglucosamine 2-epimerase (non-hydrolyzing) [Bradyrhizobium sp. CCBAU 11434]MDA9521382.1 hypothetical protein [Bradyrhizobium sp. CCBAU 11434]